MRKRLLHLITPCVLIFAPLVGAQVTFTTRVEWAKGNSGADRSAAGVVVWLVPTGDTPVTPVVKDSHPRLIQKNKTFQPHVLVVPAGSVVEFPNRDPFFHNVFSLFEGRRFDLGLYEGGTTREVHFNKAGVSYIFCNIHPEMSAVIIAIPTPYYAVSDAQGEIVIPNVNAGHYLLHLWYEGTDKPDTEIKEITVSERNSTQAAIELMPRSIPGPHKNIYGRDYDPPTPPSPGYDQH